MSERGIFVTQQHWLDRYGKGYHAWRRDGKGERWSRPCGLYEAKFDADGQYGCGRADISELLTIGLTTRLSGPALRHHVLLAFTLLRLQHSLLRGRAEQRALGPWFSVDVPATADSAIRDAATAMSFPDFLGGEELDLRDLLTHSLNVRRILNPSEALARVFVLPVEREEKEGSTRKTLRVMFVLAHEIVDGLSVVRWLWHFVTLLNMSTAQIRREIEKSVRPESVFACLPPAQEDLFGPVAPTKARTRWFWAITVILRHVKKPPPPALPNPLRRATPLPAPRPFKPKYTKMFDYSQTPPLNTLTARVRLSPAASQRLFRLCKEAKASVGAGGFALVAMAMMAMHEAEKPAEAADEQRPFRTSFPLNPRPFIEGAATSDGVVLAAAPGLALPFLSSRLDLEGRFRLLARQASRQLAAYQKRDKKALQARSTAEAARYMGIGGPGRLIASNYIDGIERLRGRLPSHLREAISSPQTKYEAAAFDLSQVTCEVSSMGKVDFSAMQRDLNTDPGADGVIASVEGLMNVCRARETEFGVATLSQDGIMQAEISFDANVIDEDRVPAWLEKMRSLLEVPGQSDPKSRL
ncbi:hypothetical protein GGS20DRAFT_574763 [Poronia punctata]|nr:hypothetical protein GGS20DRAFT_574763 [Poronia punctata]